MSCRSGHVQNALKVVEYLNNHPQVEKVHHPAVSTENIDTSHKGMQAFADQTQEIIASALWEEYK